MSDKNKFLSVAILSSVVIFAASTAHAHEWGWERSYYHDRYCHHRHHGYDRSYYRHEGDHSYGKIVIRLPGKFFSIVVGGRRYYQCDGDYYRRNGRYFEIVPSPYGSSVAERYEGGDRGGSGDYRDY